MLRTFALVSELVQQHVEQRVVIAFQPVSQFTLLTTLLRGFPRISTADLSIYLYIYFTRIERHSDWFPAINHSVYDSLMDASHNPLRRLPDPIVSPKVNHPGHALPSPVAEESDRWRRRTAGFGGGEV